MGDSIYERYWDHTSTQAKDWRRDERIEEKEKKKKDWYKEGGFDSVLFAPMDKQEFTIKRRVKFMEYPGWDQGENFF